MKGFTDLNSPYLKELFNKNLELSSSYIPVLSIPPEFSSKTHTGLTKENYSKKLREIIEPIAQNAEQLGYSPNIYTALYEGTLNAYQHGNKYDPNKEIRISSKSNPTSLEFIIEDEGEFIEGQFIPYVLAVQNTILKGESFPSWYSFSGKQKPQTNNGTGTSFIHQYVDEVGYFKSKDLGGLALYLKKEK